MLFGEPNNMQGKFTVMLLVEEVVVQSVREPERQRSDRAQQGRVFG